MIFLSKHSVIVIFVWGSHPAVFMDNSELYTQYSRTIPVCSLETIWGDEDETSGHLLSIQVPTQCHIILDPSKNNEFLIFITKFLQFCLICVLHNFACVTASDCSLIEHSWLAI